ncbi:aspartic proteinase CDR1-like [Lotus japonicus]|uniref:aspartic proteinase CDR1-like n=1 Tax=Lotus japonicus TaxID=34305 RepID=UPI00258C310C|nr:aspartic proteinase CDR1-like [Lotus japonicus]
MANILCFFHLCFLVVLYLLSCQTPIEAQDAGFSVQLTRQNSPHSPFYKPDNLHRHKLPSFHQVPKKAFAPNGPFSTRVTSNNGDYLMKLTLGSPPVDIYGLVDTGSDLVWAQCSPCHGCYKQKSPMFEPLSSKTFNPIPCDSEQCGSLFSHSCSPQKLCAYSYSYADSSVTKGVLARETITFSSPTNGDELVVGDIIFGCGHSNSGAFNENDMGVIGLGGGPLSLVSQMGALYGSRRFSQCLVPFHADSRTSGTISFGDASDVSGEGVVTTPLVSEEGQTPYLVTLEGISVGDTFVSFNSSEKLSKGNMMIDSGTPATYLPQEFYDRLVEELKVQSSLLPVDNDPDLGTQLCYRSETNLEGPILTAHFEGADVQLMPIQTFIPPKDGVFCFAMAGTADGDYIFGNFAQSNILIGFDLDRKTISFKPTDCTNP